MDILEAAAIILSLVLGGMIKGATGIGAPFVAIPAIATVTDIRQAIIIMLAPTIVTNLWQSWAFRGAVRELTFLRPMVIATIAGMFAGTWALVWVPIRLLSLLLGVVILLFIGVRLARPLWALSREKARQWAIPVGAFAGALQGAAGLSGPVSVTFLSSMKLSREQFAGSMSLVFLVSTLAQVAALAWAGLLEGHLLFWSLAALVPMALGMGIGSWSARFISPVFFQRLILVILAALAGKLFFDALLA